MRQAKINQDGFVGATKHDAARLDIVMNHVLPVQVSKRRRDLSGNRYSFFVRQREIADPAVERLARNLLDHDIGLPPKITSRETGGYVRASQTRPDHLLHLKADDFGGGPPPPEAGGFFSKKSS